jgi:hypothetical protein
VTKFSAGAIGGNGYGIFSGLEHPVFLWNSVTLIGAYNERDVNEFVRTLTEKHVKHSFSIFQEKGSMAKTVTLVLDSPGHRFLSTPQAYVNGVRFGVLTKGDLICVEKVQLSLSHLLFLLEMF